MKKQHKAAYPPKPVMNMPLAPDLPPDMQSVSTRNIESVSPRDMNEISREAKTNIVMQKPREMIADTVARDTDPNGSYTGAPVNRYEKPVQDADDL
jgi:hypothetical protein